MALEVLIGIRSQIAEIDAKINAFGSEKTSIESDQSRFRENIESLSKTPEAKALIERYIAKAGVQETRLEQIENEKRSLQKERLSLEEQFSSKVRSLEAE